MKLLKSLSAWMLIVILAFGFVACSDDDDDNGTSPQTTNFETVAEDVIEYVNNVRPTTNKPATAVNQMLVDNENVFIIDLRAASDYQAGHIDVSGASNAQIVNWPVSDLADNLDQIPAGAKVVNVCYTGQTASFATAYLRLEGVEAYNMLFGMCGWTDSGTWTTYTDSDLALETTANSWPAASDVPSITGTDISALFDAFAENGVGDEMKNATDVYAMVNGNDDVFVINYWPEAEYDNGHVPTSVQLTPQTLSMDVLQKIPAGTPVVVYCYTGQTSSQMASVLNILGYEAYSLKFGMNAIDQTHTNNHGFPGGAGLPTVTE